MRQAFQFDGNAFWFDMGAAVAGQGAADTMAVHKANSNHDILRTPLICSIRFSLSCVPRHSILETHESLNPIGHPRQLLESELLKSL